MHDMDPNKTKNSVSSEELGETMERNDADVKGVPDNPDAIAQNQTHQYEEGPETTDGNATDVEEPTTEKARDTVLRQEGEPGKNPSTKPD